MTSFTAADLKLGGRLVAACDALGLGHLNRAAGIFNEIADDLNNEATQAGLLAPDEPAEDDWSAPLPAAPQSDLLVDRMMASAAQAEPVDLQMCSRNVHSFGAPDPVSGWRTCSACGTVNVAPPGGGPVDMSSRPLGDM